MNLSDPRAPEQLGPGVKETKYHQHGSWLALAQTPGCKRAVDTRADLLPQEYLNKARGADQTHNQIPVGTIGPVERKLVELGEVQGIVAGNFGEVSEDTHALVAALATCRVRVAGVSRGRKGHMRTEEGERSLAISGLRRRLGVLTGGCQAHSLLGRLEALGPGATAAAGRRWQAAELERCWRREERAHTLATAQGWSAYRTGFGKLSTLLCYISLLSG